MINEEINIGNRPQRTGWYAFTSWYKSLHSGHQVAIGGIAAFIFFWCLMALSVAGIGGWVAFKMTILISGIIFGVVGLVAGIIMFFVGMEDAP